MKKSKQLSIELEKAKAQYKQMCHDLYKKSQKLTSEQYKHLNELSKKIDNLEFELIKERRREIEVGDGCTLVLWTDKKAHTVIRKTKKMIVMQRDKAIKSPNFKPEWVEGGFSAICTNQNEQEYTYEKDPNGSTIRAFWSEVNGCYMHDGCKVINGRHEFYDYNF